MPTSHVAHPGPINQFYRLDKASPTSPWVKTTPWNHTHRDANGVMRDWDGYLCMAAGGGVLADASTGGRVRYSPGQVHDAQNDNLGGIGVDDVKLALKRLGGIDVFIPANTSFDDMVARVHLERRHALFGVDYRHIPYSVQLQHPGNFDHAMNLDDVDGQWGLFYDSLGTHPIWRLLSDVKPGAEALALRERGTRGSLFASFSPSRPALSTGKFEVVLPSIFFIYDVRGYTVGTGGGQVIGRRHSYRRGAGSPVPVTPPPSRSTTSGIYPSRRLVQITKGIYANRYIAASYAHLA